ncbi:c9b9981b-8309-4c9c-b9ac-1da10a28b7f6-CDS [Sclerotinia trifoliorum]|uniref:C9b9981b-8309-4c9c-b9ac-1da10a28b7f6-CDS n=1 Tax=Sclerotinia trifoliorum TaxID=28548 RepID=A0A8H2ZML4_9HELO|nr:c9b9981b-8309-4c9c-b9ac-1da10a28b7f6-CDS [Sclerotinia trifoliorum]
MVHYEQRKARLVLRNTPGGGGDPPRLVLRQQREESPFPNGNNTTNIPLHMAYLQQPYHGSFHNVGPGTLPYATFQHQLPMTYNVPLNMNMAAGHVALRTVNTRTHHHNIAIQDGRGPENGDDIYAECTPVLEERRDENTGRVSPRVALRTMMQQTLRPNTQPDKFGRQTHYTQHSHYPRDAFRISSSGASVESDISICPPIDRCLEANIREQLARSGLLRDCPDPEYVSRPMAVDPSIISCGRALKQLGPMNHRRPQYLFGRTQPCEEFRFNREFTRAPLVNNSSPQKFQKNTGIPTYRASPQSTIPQIQTYRGVDSVIKEPKRKDSPQSYKVEAGSKFLTKDDYTPTKRIIGYYVDSSSDSPKSAQKLPIEPLSIQEETTPRPSRQPVKDRLGGASEPEMTQPPIREGKYKVNMSEDISKISAPSTETVAEGPPPKLIKSIDRYTSNPKDCVHVTARELSEEESTESPDGKKAGDLLEDCIRSLATWEKGDREVLHKLLKVLKRLDDDGDNDFKSIENLKIAHDTKRSPRKKRGSSNTLNPEAACFEDFASERAHITRTYHERQSTFWKEEINPTSNEMLPMFYPKPLMPAEPVWIKSQPKKLVLPPPGLSIPCKAHVGRKVPVKTTLKQPLNEDDEGRTAKAMDLRLAAPLLARFYEKYPLTGTICTNPPSPPPVAVKSAAEIQEELERLLLQEKEKKAFANPFATKPRASNGAAEL